jgi:hypothetical protein
MNSVYTWIIFHLSLYHVPNVGSGDTITQAFARVYCFIRYFYLITGQGWATLHCHPASIAAQEMFVTTVGRIESCSSERVTIDLPCSSCTLSVFSTSLALSGLLVEKTTSFGNDTFVYTHEDQRWPAKLLNSNA